jgi:carbon-monoxide dehydrogenase large subunit
VFFAEGTGGSRSAAFSGSAFTLAADKVETKAKAIAAHMLKVDTADIKFADGVFSSQKTNQTLTIKEVAKASLEPKNLPQGMEPGLIEKAIYTGHVASYPNGVHVCELEIDEETGEVEIVDYNVVDDVGTVINPLLLHGQVDGGIAMGVGQVLMEDIKFDEQGQILTGSFMDYAMPRATDLIGFHVESNPVPTKTNPLGVKGAGEAGSVGARHQAYRFAGDARAAVAGDPRGAGEGRPAVIIVIAGLDPAIHADAPTNGLDQTPNERMLSMDRRIKSGGDEREIET